MGRDGFKGMLASSKTLSIKVEPTEVRIDEVELLASDYPNTTPIPSVGQGGTVTIGGGGYLIFAPITKKGVR